METGAAQVVEPMEVEAVGDEVDVEALAGATLLHLDSVTDFGDEDDDPVEAGGWALLRHEDGTTVALQYDGVVEDDPDADDGRGSLTLSAPLAATVPAFTRIDLYNGDPDNGGTPVLEYEVLIVEDGQDGGDPLPATVRPDMADAPPEVGDTVEWERDDEGDEIVVTRVVGRQLSRDSGYLSVPIMLRYVLLDRPRGNGNWVNIGGTTAIDEVGMAETATQGVYEVHEAGLYEFVGVVTFSAANTGTRRARFMFDHGGVTRTGSTIIVSATASGSDTVLTVDWERMEPGDGFWLESYQNSGAQLDIRGDADGKFTNIKARRVAP